jgi:PAS domain S-box-containing protein
MPKKNGPISKIELIRQIKDNSRAFKEEKAKASALISSIGDGVIATNEYGQIVEINKVALDALQYKRSELINSWFPSKIVALKENGTKINPLDRPCLRVFLTGNTISEELRYQRKDGSSFPSRLTVSPIYLKGKPVGCIEIFRDISKEIETERLKSEFITLASHQLRTPLSSIGLYSQMLNDNFAGKITKKQRDLLSVIISSTKRMNSLINTLLNITRTENGSLLIESTPNDLAEILEYALTSFKPRIDNKNLTVVTNIDADLPIVNTDTVIINEIYNNLISNAIKYTPSDGKITIKLTTKRKNILFSIKDTGYGIPLDAQQFIFTKFYRASNILEHDVTGTGLGLYFCKKLADRINGDVWFESIENSGTSFFFSIPINSTLSQDGTFRLESTIE